MFAGDTKTSEDFANRAMLVSGSTILKDTLKTRFPPRSHYPRNPVRTHPLEYESTIFT
jgi:hypothetical protein